MSKPILSFVKMMGCGPCNNFFGSPDPEKSQWAQLVKDPELGKIVEFSLSEWGFDRVSGAQYKKPVHLNFIQYGPAFVLVDGVNKETHLEYDKNLPKTASGIKKWVLQNYKKLKSGPVSAPVQAKTSGMPLSFVSQEKLPQQLRNKSVATKVAPHAPHPGHNDHAPHPGHPSHNAHSVSQVPMPIPMAQPVTLQFVPPVAATKPQVKNEGLRIVPRNTRYVGRRR